MKNKYTVFCSDCVFGMANLNPNKTGLPVIIWSDHSGIFRNKKDNDSRIKIGINNSGPSVSVTIEQNPRILAKSKNIKKSDMKKLQEGIDYVGRNYDLFLKHYQDTSFDFDDEDLFNALRERGEYK